MSRALIESERGMPGPEKQAGWCFSKTFKQHLQWHVCGKEYADTQIYCDFQSLGSSEV